MVKLEADGSFAWARSFPATGELGFDTSEGDPLSIDQTGALYVTGAFQGELQLEPGQPAVATAEEMTSFWRRLPACSSALFGDALSGDRGMVCGAVALRAFIGMRIASDDPVIAQTRNYVVRTKPDQPQVGRARGSRPRIDIRVPD